MKIRTPITPPGSIQAHALRVPLAIIAVLALAFVGVVYMLVQREAVTAELLVRNAQLARRCPLPERLDQYVVMFSDGTCSIITVRGSDRGKKEKKHVRPTVG